MNLPGRKSKSKKPSTQPDRSLRGRRESLRALINEYPRQFWVLVLTTFIDRLGGSLLFPFFSLYVTRKFEVGMTQVGIIFGIFSITGLISSVIGGALTDRMGRKWIMIFGLVMSATSALLMGIINDFFLFIIVTSIVGLLADLGFPAQQALVADLLPEHKRAQGYGIIRVMFNLAVVIGPMIGGLLAARSYLLLFIIDSIASLITAGIVFVAIKETKKAREQGEPQESMGQTFKGYFHVLRDSAFTWFILASMLSALVYMQMNTTLGVYLRDVHGLTEQMYGYILSMNAAMVVLFQFPITRWISKYRPLMVMVAGTLMYAVGFGMYGFTSLYPMFLLAMAIITVGEMFVSPVSQSIVSALAPEDMRGRYMATFGFSWVIPSAVGPLLAGLVIDNLDPRLIWYAAGIIGFISAATYYYIEQKVGRARWVAIDARLNILEQLEEDKITAEEAAHLLGQVNEGTWTKLRSEEAASKHKQLRIRMSDQEDAEAAQKELYLPVGLINTILNTTGRLSSDLEPYFDGQKLRALISRSMDGSPSATEADGTKRVEVSLE